MVCSSPCDPKVPRGLLISRLTPSPRLRTPFRNRSIYSDDISKDPSWSLHAAALSRLIFSNNTPILAPRLGCDPALPECAAVGACRGR